MIIFSQGNRLVWKSVKSYNTVKELTINLNTYSAVFSRDEKYVAVYDDVAKIYIYNTKSGELKKTLWGHVDMIESIDFSPNGRRLLTTSRDGSTKLWSLDDLYR